MLLSKLRRNILLVVLLAWILLSWGESFVSAAEKSSFPKLGPGLSYIQERFGDEPLAIHVLKIDRTRNDFALTTTLAKGSLFGLETMSDQIKQIPSAVGEPVAAINGDFFAIAEGPFQGTICGAQIYQDQLISEPAGPMFWIAADGQPRIEDVKSNFQINWPNGEAISFALNNDRADDAVVLYTPFLGESTRTKNGVEYIMEIVSDEKLLKAGEVYRARVLAVSGNGNTPLKTGTLVLSVGPKKASTLPALKVNDEITFSTATSPGLKDVRLALAGNQILLHEGKAPAFPDKDRHPRTAFGWNDQFFFFVVVDGRQEGLSRGMNYEELSQLMQQIGATEALNFDGGGSSTLWLGGQVVNSPSDGHERAVANGLVLLRREVTTAPATQAAVSTPAKTSQDQPQVQPQTSAQVPAQQQTVVAQPTAQVVVPQVVSQTVIVQPVPHHVVILPPPPPARVIITPRRPCPPYDYHYHPGRPGPDCRPDRHRR
jgi:hypothetical protein